MTNAALARLAFWAKNLTALHRAGMEWPGFAYTEPEWTRMASLSSGIDAGLATTFNNVTALAFIVLAAIGIVALFLPLASWLFPDPAKTATLPFVVLLAAVAFFILGVGIPVAMRVSSAFCSRRIAGTLTAEPGDDELAHKVSFQIGRMTAIMCLVFVPGTMLWVAFNVHAGPIITAIKWLSIAAMMIGVAYSRYGGPKA